MSFGYWRSRHNRHHTHCQEIDGDPDMHFGVLVLRLPELGQLADAAGRFFLRIQKWAFWPLASFYWVALRYDAIRDLFQRPARPRSTASCCRCTGSCCSSSRAGLAGRRRCSPTSRVSCLSSLMTASVFIPNHIGHAPARARATKLSYLEQQVTTSRNISNPPLLDFYYGGLNSQIEHHLFPRVAAPPLPRDAADRARFLPGARARLRGGELHRALASVGNHLGAMTAAHAASCRR